MNAVTRPLVRWYGGKWRLAPWIIAHMPPHRVYVEPFGGAGSVLLRKSRVGPEVWNDLDSEVVNLFRVLRNPMQSARLIKLLRLTPFAREEFVDACEIVDEPIERARRLIVIGFMGFGSNAHNRHSTGFRNSLRDGQSNVATEWAEYPDALRSTVERLKRVMVENRPAISVMRRFDGRDTLHYVDPPYVWDTRLNTGAHHPKWRGYAHELSDDDHRDLLVFLGSLRGMVLLSGYAHPIYDDVLTNWRRLERRAYADGARPRTEVLWLNPHACAALDATGAQATMFGAAS